MSFTETLQSITGKLLADCTDQELYLALLELVRQKSADRVQPVTGRKLYYISAEFLIGKLLSNNLINLGLYEEARDALAAAGKRLSDIEEVEPEPSLGNGGLGRLAACFLDSLATLNLPGDGVGLRYHFGLFHQSFEDGVQNEKPDPWLTAHSWAEKTDVTYPVELAGKEYTARLYKLAVTGYEGRTNTLNLFDLDTIDESIVHDGIAFDKTAIDKNLTLFLYPDDSDEAGRRLRVYQQYLMVSAGAQLILAECAARGCNYHDLADYAAIQINDTHPSMVIPELIRLLGQRGIEFEEAVEIVTKTCAYTNHTILAEALDDELVLYSLYSTFDLVQKSLLCYLVDNGIIKGFATVLALLDDLCTELLPAHIHKWCQMGQGKCLPAVLVAGNLCHDLRGDVACREEAVRLLNHGLTDHCSVLQHILKVDEVTVVLLLSVVVRIMEMYDSGLMCLNYILRQKHSLGQIFGYLTGHVVTLCRVDHRILV